ncbi:MAG: 3-deoxy-7-phosphoheptulonate synthase [Planctomycetes bacterium]|nr:3-deoxy-7-phosphoheptulonate synthase [Planctomycetota bacterium]
MIIVLRPGTTEEELQELVARIRDLGLDVNISRGVKRTVVGIIGEEDEVRLMPLAAISCVEQVMPVLSPYELASREFHPEPTLVSVGPVTIGEGAPFVVVAGPCAVESAEQLRETAVAVRQAGGAVLRGGAFKPRSSPYSFQGLGEEGLKLLRAMGQELGMPVVTEVMDTRQVALVAEYADILQIGARNMQNFALLTEVGQVGKPVLLKRGMWATVKELLMSAEYILSNGNEQVVLCERGIKSFEDSVRNVLDLSSVPNIKGTSHLPVIVDPSHATGRWDLVAPMACAALAAGADGVMVEVHPHPEDALCDGPQALLPERFIEMMERLGSLAAALGRGVHNPSSPSP